ncbi:uncharacterized protein LOC115624359 [Scaptodrosophila lebanonensis]|uniref:Uncharacterized protein LOC115624359 n=1 Tax=Drosophila lebanonensis TaxID=7225 RepID=A0A6J2TFV4_DROLE|nr:uncharacterized protein LOC115624359 [Scaptodrosophila lebanonensis]
MSTNIVHNTHDGGVDYVASTEEKKKPMPKWYAWCERNSKPIKRVRPKVVKEPTPWQKPGPMKKKDWKRFCAWADTKARPKEKEYPPLPVPCEADYLPCGRTPPKKELADLLDKMEELSKPLERKKNQKHEYIYDKPTYSPVIVWGRPPLHDKGRPFELVKKPKCFVNPDVENEFWSNLRFPIRPGALKFRPSPRILTLANPRVTPPFPPHCEIPPKTLLPLEVPPPPRKKFTPRGWRLHQIRLIYLAKPVSRPDYEYFYL